MASQIESHRAGAEVVNGERRLQEEVRRAPGGAWPPKGPAALGGHRGVRLQPRGWVHVAGAGEEEGGAHLQEDQADHVVRQRGHGFRLEGEAEEHRRRQDQRVVPMAQHGGGVRSRVLAGEGHL